MRSVMLFMGGLARFFYRVIATPLMFGWLIGAMAFGAMLGTLFAVPFIFAFFDQEPGQSAWQWIVFGPFILIGAVFGFQYWRMQSGADSFFGLTGDSHGEPRRVCRRLIDLSYAAMSDLSRAA